MPKNYCGFKTSNVRPSRKSAKSGRSGRSGHTRRTCYNTDKADLDDQQACMIGQMKSCVNKPRAGETMEGLESKRSRSRSKRRQWARQNTPCGGRDMNECRALQPKCGWASGETRSYCRKQTQQ